MATKTTKKTTLPKIAKKWYDFTINPKYLRPVMFSWGLASGVKNVVLYGSDTKPQEDILHLNLRNTIMSYYFIFYFLIKFCFLFTVIPIQSPQIYALFTINPNFDPRKLPYTPHSFVHFSQKHKIFK